MKRTLQLLRWLVLAALGLCMALPGQAKTVDQTENRFLFLIDTAAAMRSYSNSVVRTVAELLGSDMKGEFRDGDTIGLWTYNDQLHTEFPMQVWSSNRSQAVLDNIAGYLIEQHYEKFTHLERVMPLLNQVIKNSDRVTVILISDGNGAITGTPFDKDIATLQKKFSKELRSAHVPFVLVLAARGGAVFDYTINYPGLISIPHTARPEKVVETNAPVAAVPVPVVEPPVAPRPMRSFIMSARTNAPKPVAPTPPVVTAPSAAPVMAAPAPAPVPVVVKPIVQPSPTVAVPPAPAVAPAPVVQPAPTAVVATTAPEPAPVPQPAPPPVVAATNQPPPPVTTAPAVANATPAGSSQTSLFIAAFVLLMAAVMIIVFLMRRSRYGAESSLISQSIDRPGTRPRSRPR